MRIHVLLLIVTVLLACSATGQIVTNVKGTRLSLDTSKWRLSGADMYNKNTGNVGIGLSLPLYKLDVSATANPLRLTGLQAGAATDSVLTVQNGVVRFATISRLITDTSLYNYDAVLAGNRTVTFGSNSLSLATGGSAFNITGLTGGTLNDSLVTISTATGRINRIAPSLLLRQDSTTASNGLSLSTKDVRLGGNLTQATTITSNANTLTFATGSTALNITGLTSGVLTDSLVTVNAATGRINRITPGQLLRPDSTTASNGITLSGLDVQLGGTLTKKDTITTSATNTLALRGLQAGTNTDSLLTIEPGTGVIRKIQQQPISSVVTTASQINSATTTVTINTLNFTTVAGYTYRVKLWLVYNAAATGTGIRLAPNAFAGGDYWYSTSVSTSTTASQYISGYNGVNILVSTGSRATTNNVATIEMTVDAASAATVSFQFGSEVAGSAITIQPNSRLEYQVIN